MEFLFFAWLAIKFGICKAPHNFSIKEIAGIGALAGMGLTLSLVIADLAYSQNNELNQVKIGLVISAIISAIFLILLSLDCLT